MTELVLGTAQFGAAYGATNLLGAPDDLEVSRILSAANSFGIQELDTAFLYEGSEIAIGMCESARPFGIITKTDKVGLVSGEVAVGRVRGSFATSRERLRRQSVDGLLVHDADDLLGPAGAALYEFLSECRESGAAGKIGVSIYDSGQIDACLEMGYVFDLVQLPLSVFDQRLLRSGHLSRLAENGIAIHVRSAFLQGLVLVDPGHLTDEFQAFARPLRLIREDADRANTTPMVLSLGFLRSIPEVSGIVVGVTSEGELRQVCDAFIAAKTVAVDARQYEILDEDLIDPRRWPRDTKAVRSLGGSGVVEMDSTKGRGPC